MFNCKYKLTRSEEYKVSSVNKSKKQNCSNNNKNEQESSC